MSECWFCYSHYLAADLPFMFILKQWHFIWHSWFRAS